MNKYYAELKTLAATHPLGSLITFITILVLGVIIGVLS